MPGCLELAEEESGGVCGVKIQFGGNKNGFFNFTNCC